MTTTIMANIGGNSGGSSVPSSGGAAPSSSANSNSGNQSGNQQTGRGAAATDNNADVSSSGSDAASTDAKTQLTKDLKNAKTEEQKAAAIRKYKYKVDGKDVVREFSDDEISRRLSKAEAADKRFEEGASQRQYAEKIINLMKTDPERALQLMGHDPDELAIRRVKHKIDQEMNQSADPEKAKMQAELEIHRQKEAAEKEERANADREEVKKHYRGQIQQDIVKSLDTPEGRMLPRTDYTIERIAKYMARSMQLGYKDVTPQHVLGTVWKDYQSDFSAFARTGSPEQLINLLGKEALQKIREFELNQLHNPNNTPLVMNRNQTGQFVPRETKPMTKEEWQAELDRRTGVTR